jgi:hypothetical protein
MCEHEQNMKIILLYALDVFMLLSKRSYRIMLMCIFYIFCFFTQFVCLKCAQRCIFYDDDYLKDSCMHANDAALTQYVAYTSNQLRIPENCYLFFCIILLIFNKQINDLNANF